MKYLYPVSYTHLDVYKRQEYGGKNISFRFLLAFLHNSYNLLLQWNVALSITISSILTAIVIFKEFRSYEKTEDKLEEINAI